MPGRCLEALRESMVAGGADEVDGFREVVEDADQTVEELGVAVVAAVADAAAAAAAVAERSPIAVEEYSVDQDKDQLYLSEGGRRAQDTGTDTRLVERSLDLVDKDSLEDREERRAVERILEDEWHPIEDNHHWEVTLYTLVHRPSVPG
jgi:hypothetical protein